MTGKILNRKKPRHFKPAGFRSVPGSKEPRAKWFAGLAVLSGACGLAYEILFVRLFSNYFGDGFVVAGITLCAVFLGISFGAWNSARLIRYLAWIEVGIGIYAVAAATLFSQFGFQIAGWHLSTWATMLKLAVLLGVPAFLIGACVPLFSAYAREQAPEGSRVFTRIYGLYNLGALVSIFAIEFWLFRQFGLQDTIYIIAALNFLTGAVLLRLLGPKPQLVNIQTNPALQKHIAVGLFLASVASGIFQLFVLRISFSVFGPLQENFAIILASAIGGVAIGALVARRSKLTLEWALVALGITLLGLASSVGLLITAWSKLASWDINDATEVFAKAVLLGGFPLIGFALFGALVPLAVQAHDSEDGVPGKLLAISSLGNGIGALLMFLVLYRMLTMPEISLIIAGLALVASVLVSKGQFNRTWVAVSLVALLCLVVSTLRFWPHSELLLGYRVIADVEELTYQTQNLTDERTYKSFDQNASVLSFSDASRSLVFNGYHSLTFSPDGKSELHEAVVGATPALFVTDADRALVLGLGTGVSAGAAAQLFNETIVAEINPAMLSIPAHFERENFGLMTRENVHILVQDGMSVMLDPSPSYDAIINTVTTPRFYTASKLYTDDFLKIVKSRLSSNGVYSTWFDLNMDLSGIAIMLNTLEANFQKCRYFVLADSYFNAVCADHGLLYQPRRITAERFGAGELNRIFRAYGFQTEFMDTLNSLEVSFGVEILPRTTQVVNTLDRPVIEFVVARQRDKLETSEALSDAILANIERQRRFAVGGANWKKNCRIISMMSGLLFRGCD